MIGPFGHSVTPMDRLKIPSGVRVIVYLSVPLPTFGGASIALTHRIEYGAVANSGEAQRMGRRHCPAIYDMIDAHPTRFRAASAYRASPSVQDCTVEKRPTNPDYERDQDVFLQSTIGVPATGGGSG
jgi:hypothetical protein